LFHIEKFKIIENNNDQRNNSIGKLTRKSLIFSQKIAMEKTNETQPIYHSRKLSEN